MVGEVLTERPTVPVTAVLITREAEWPTDVSVGFPFDEVLLETGCPSVARRWDLARTARNDVVYVQDDDYEIDIERLWSVFDGRCTVGVRSARVIDSYRSLRKLPAILCYGAMFRKDLIDFRPWTDRYGDLMVRDVRNARGEKVDRCELDRIFTFLARPVNFVHLPPVRIIDRPVKVSDEPGASPSKRKCMELLKELAK